MIFGKDSYTKPNYFESLPYFISSATRGPIYVDFHPESA